MYRRLIERRELYQLAVGSAPEIIADSIENEIRGRLGVPQTTSGSDAIGVLQSLRDQNQMVALNRIWDRGREPLPGADSLRQSLSKRLSRLHATHGSQVSIAKTRVMVREPGGQTFEYDTAPGTEDSLSMNHRALDIIAAVPEGPVSKIRGRFGLLLVGGIRLLPAVKSGGKLFVYSPEAIGHILDALYDGNPLNLEQSGAAWEWPRKIAGVTSLYEALKNLCRWLPQPHQMRIGNQTLGEGTIHFEGKCDVSFEEISDISITGTR